MKISELIYEMLNNGSDKLKFIGERLNNIIPKKLIDTEVDTMHTLYLGDKDQPTVSWSIRDLNKNKKITKKLSRILKKESQIDISIEKNKIIIIKSTF